GISDEPNPCNARSGLLERFEPLGRELIRQQRDTRRIAPGLCQALRNAELNGIGTHGVDNWNGLRRLHNMRRNIATDGKDHKGLALNQVRGELRKPLRPTLSIPVFNGEVLTIDIAELAKAFQKRLRARIVVQGTVD